VASVASEPTGPLRPRLRKGWLVGVMAVVVLAADQLTKTWALSRLSNFRTVHLIWTIDFQLAFNQGMAFSRGQGLGKLIAVFVVLIIIALGWFARSVDSRWQLLCIGAVMGGAAGNLSDRIFRSGTGFLGGHVVDFINPHWWPVFNVSDSAVVVGGIALALLLSFSPVPADAGPASDESG
jgi:signal peptidase II